MPPTASLSGLADTASKPKVAIIGGGVIGLGIGWRLAEAGCQVAIFERGEAGRGASWAAAGMLAAGLEAASGVDIGYRDEGSLRVALTRDDAEKLRFAYTHQTDLGIEVRWLSGAEARRLEPHLRPGVQAAIFSPHDHQVDNRRLVAALKTAFRRVGGLLRECAPVSTIDVVGGSVRGIVVGDDVHSADVVVWAAGPWAYNPNVLPPAALPPVRPIKGQMLSLQMDPGMPLLEHVLWAPKTYLVPRLDGRLIVGATVEEAGFDDRLTAGGLLALLEGAWQVLPAIEDLPIDECWVGFRPGSRDDAPILGPSAVDGLLLANGHHRHGILLTPLTSQAMSRLILTGHLLESLAGFTMARFHEKEGTMS